MFDCVLNIPLNAIKKIFSWRFQIKSNDFLNFFSTINFSYQYAPEVKAYLEPRRISAMEIFCKIFFFCKTDDKTPVLESIFNKVIGLYPATSLKERNPIQVFSDEFCDIPKTTFLQNTSRRLLLFNEKIFYQ